MNDENERGFICLAVFQPPLDLLARQIRSIQSQDARDWHCLIGIDGSDPEAHRAIIDLVGADERFSVREFEENVGFYRNFERLLAEVPRNIEWVALSDQDDEWFPTKLSEGVMRLREATLAVGQVAVVDAHGGEREISRRRVVPILAEFIDNQVTGSAAVFRRSLLDVALPFPEPTELAYHDHWLGVCALADDGIAVVDAPLQYYVQHGANVIGEEQRRSMVTRIRSLTRKTEGSPRAALRYLSEHRWGWRVKMARRLLAADHPLRERDRQMLATIARGRLSVKLIVAAAEAVLRGQAPPARTISLLVGAAGYR